jgi:hypothetical protein
MLRSELLPFMSSCLTISCRKNSGTARGFKSLWILVAFLALLASATAQTGSFTLQMSAFDREAVDPGGNAASSLTLAPLNGFTGSVALSCQITPAPPNGNDGCMVSPQTVSPPTGASVTITTAVPTGEPWSPGLYTVTITGTAPSTTPQTASQALTVLEVTPSFTITVGTVVSPTSVHAGSSASATINVNPINGYASDQTNPGVTLSCSSVTPVVVSPPVCSFSYPPGMQTLPVVSGVPVSSTLTISTIGPLTPITRAASARHFYALWLPLPMLALLGTAAGGKRFRAGFMLSLFVMCALILLIPACSTTSVPTAITPSDLITPNGTYTFTVTGVDANGTTASNLSSGTTSSVILNVTSPTTN